MHKKQVCFGLLVALLLSLSCRYFVVARLAITAGLDGARSVAQTTFEDSKRGRLGYMGYDFIAQLIPRMPGDFQLPLLLYPNYGLGVTVHLPGYRHVEMKEVVVGIDQIISLYEFKFSAATSHFVDGRKVYSFSHQFVAADERLLALRLVAKGHMVGDGDVVFNILGGTERMPLVNNGAQVPIMRFIHRYSARDFGGGSLNFEVSLPAGVKGEFDSIQILGVTWSRNSALWSQMAKAGFSNSDMRLDDYEFVKMSDSFQHYVAVDRGFIARVKGHTIPGWEKFEDGVLKPN